MNSPSDMAQKICQLCTVDFTLYHFLRPLMHGLRNEGHEVVGVCADGELADAVRDEGFRVEKAPLVRSAALGDTWRAVSSLRTMFLRERFDIVHVHTPVAAFAGRIAAARARVPRIVYTAHGFYFHEHMPAPRRQMHIAAEWLAGRTTHTLFTQAEEDAATARRLRLCKTGDIRAIGNGSDPSLFAPAESSEGRARTRAAIGTPDSRVVIMVAGRLVAEKGYIELFDAMQKVDAELWVVGPRLSSDHAAGIESRVAGIGDDPDMRDRVRFLGYRDDVADLLRASDVFTLPSHREGMPRSIIEAMLTGLPVVATNIRGSREEVIDGETGLLVPVRDTPALTAALQSLCGNPDLRARMGRAGRERALIEFDEQKVIDRQIDHLGLRAR